MTTRGAEGPSKDRRLGQHPDRLSLDPTTGLRVDNKPSTTELRALCTAFIHQTRLASGNNGSHIPFKHLDYSDLRHSHGSSPPEPDPRMLRNEKRSSSEHQKLLRVDVQTFNQLSDVPFHCDKDGSVDLNQSRSLRSVSNFRSC